MFKYAVKFWLPITGSKVASVPLMRHRASFAPKVTCHFC